MKQNYELACLLSPRLTPDQTQELSRQVHDFIQEQEGMILSSQPARQLSLAYKIKKEAAAYFLTTNLVLEKTKLADLEKKLKESKEILRFLIVRKETVRARPPVRFAPRKEKIAEREISPKVELAEIEKKLEAILK